METTGRWVLVRPLGLAKQLAFLSVVLHFSASSEEARPRKRPCLENTNRDLDLGRLDHSVVSLIFEFAVQGVTRRLDLKGCEGYYFDSNSDSTSNDEA